MQFQYLKKKKKSRDDSVYHVIFAWFLSRWKNAVVDITGTVSIGTSWGANIQTTVICSAVQGSNMHHIYVNLPQYLTMSHLLWHSNYAVLNKWAVFISITHLAVAERFAVIISVSFRPEDRSLLPSIDPTWEALFKSQNVIWKSRVATASCLPSGLNVTASPDERDEQHLRWNHNWIMKHQSNHI